MSNEVKTLVGLYAVVIVAFIILCVYISVAIDQMAHDLPQVTDSTATQVTNHKQ